MKTEEGNTRREVFEWIKVILLSLILAFSINTFVIANSRVPSGSMETTIMSGDRIIGSRLSYKLGGKPNRGDIVIFKHKTGPGEKETRLVKRIIGLSGETVDIRNNHIYINESEMPLEETYLREAMETGDYHFKIPENCYLMLGDNRNNSADARFWPDPYVPKEKILAKVLIRYYPEIKRIK